MHMQNTCQLTCGLLWWQKSWQGHQLRSTPRLEQQPEDSVLPIEGVEVWNNDLQTQSLCLARKGNLKWHKTRRWRSTFDLPDVLRIGGITLTKSESMSIGLRLPDSCSSSMPSRTASAWDPRAARAPSNGRHLSGNGLWVKKYYFLDRPHYQFLSPEFRACSAVTMTCPIIFWKISRVWAGAFSNSGYNR